MRGRGGNGKRRSGLHAGSRSLLCHCPGGWGSQPQREVRRPRHDWPRLNGFGRMELRRNRYRPTGSAIMMTPQTVLGYVKAEPFRPFRIHMASGKTFDVRHPEMIKVLKSNVLCLQDHRRHAGDPRRVGDCVAYADRIHLLSGSPRLEMSLDLMNGPVKGTFSFVSLGCSKNLVDSERMLGLLRRKGMSWCRTQPARTWSSSIPAVSLIPPGASRWRSSARRSRRGAGAIKGVIVAGCLAEREKERLLEEVPEVDQVVGVFGREEIARIADHVLGGSLDEQRAVFRPAAVQAQDDRARLRITPRHLAYLKVLGGV